jgi:mannose-6-phosphate isomerase-like protein (cupin superfamily)
MDIRELPLVKEGESGPTYQLDGYTLRLRWAGYKGGMHEHETPEELVFVHGKAKITIDEESKEVEAPFIVRFPPDTYHEILYVSDVAFLEKRG